MDIEESRLMFRFRDDTEVIKFDDTSYYEKAFHNLPFGKGVDFVVDSRDGVSLIEVKNCTGYERENKFRTRCDFVCKQDYNENSFDIEVAQKTASTLACLTGAWTMQKRTEKAEELIPFWKAITDHGVWSDEKKLLIILVLQGDFGSKSRSKKMIMKSIQDSLKKKLSWLNCKVSVVDSDTCQDKEFSIVCH